MWSVSAGLIMFMEGLRPNFRHLGRERGVFFFFFFFKQGGKRGEVRPYNKVSQWRRRDYSKYPKHLRQYISINQEAIIVLLMKMHDAI